MTNLVGNGVATVAISRWEGELTAETLNANLCRPFHIELPDNDETAQPQVSELSRSEIRIPDGTLDALGVQAK